MFFKNKKLNVLVLGCKGMLGKELVEILKENSKDKNGIVNVVHGLDLPEVDFSKHNTGLFGYLLDSIKYDYVINCAAITDTKGIEGDLKDVSYAVNARFLSTLSETCKRFNMKLIHISTDYVFSENMVPYRNAHSIYDEPFPINTYGLHKLLGEKFIQEKLPEKQYCIMRVSWLYGKHNNKSFVHKFLKNCVNTKENEYADIVVNCTSDEISVPTSCTAVCNEILAVMHDRAYGIRHSCDKYGDITNGMQGVSRSDFARAIVILFRQAYIEKYKVPHPILNRVSVNDVKMNNSGIMRYPKYSAMFVNDNITNDSHLNWKSELAIFISKNLDSLVEYIKPKEVKMQCYNVTCIDDNGNEHNVGVMTSSKEKAMLCAEKSLLEGQHIHTLAKDATEVDGI